MARMRQIDSGEIDPAWARTTHPKAGPLAIFLGYLGGTTLGILVHLIISSQWVSASTVGIGLIPLFGIDCTTKLFQRLVFVALGGLLGAVAGIVCSVVGWRQRPLLAASIAIAGIGLSAIATAGFASLDWNCAGYTGGRL